MAAQHVMHTACCSTACCSSPALTHSNMYIYDMTHQRRRYDSSPAVTYKTWCTQLVAAACCSCLLQLVAACCSSPAVTHKTWCTQLVAAACRSLLQLPCCHTFYAYTQLDISCCFLSKSTQYVMKHNVKCERLACLYHIEIEDMTHV
jgi:hypothetical protein